MVPEKRASLYAGKNHLHLHTLTKQPQGPRPSQKAQPHTHDLAAKSAPEFVMFPCTCGCKSEAEQKTLCDDSLGIGGHGGLAGDERRAAVWHDGSSVTVAVELH